MSFGDYLQIQRENKAFQVDIAITGAEVLATHAKTVRSANHTLYVQRIVLSITTHVATFSLTVQDDANTPVPIAKRTDLAGAAGVPDVIEWNFGPRGTALTAGKNLDYLANAGGSGFVGRLHIEGYEKQSATVNLGTAASAN